MLEGSPIDELQFAYIIMSSEALNLILNNKKVQYSLRVLRFEGMVFNEDIFKIICQSRVIYQLKTLIFDTCSIQNSDLKLLTNLTLQHLQELSLKGNYISTQGFQYLSQINLPNLKSLNLQATSLISNSSINSILKLNITNLTQLNIGYTSISSQNAYKLISSINVSNMTYLNINNNNFNQQFYINISKFSFAKMKVLKIDDLLIDEEVILYLKKMKLPELQTLFVGGNWLFTNKLYLFLNNKNYPKLINLTINNTVFDNRFIQYLMNQFKNTKFQVLQLIGDGISINGFKYLLDLNTQNIQKLSIQKGMVNPQMMSRFIKQKQFDQLEYLNLQHLVNTGQLFNQLIEKKWPKLRTLKIGRIGKIDTIKLQQIDHILFPQLQNLFIDIRQLSITQTKQLIYFLSKSCYKILHLQIFISSFHKIIQQITNKQYFNISNKIFVILKTYKQIYIKIQENRVFSAILVLKNNAIVKDITFNETLQQIYTANYINPQEDQQAKIIQDKILQNLDFTQIQRIIDSGKLVLLSSIVTTMKNQNQQCILASLQYFDIINLQSKGLEVFNKCQFPHLRQLIVTSSENMSINNNSTDNAAKTPALFTKNYPYLQRFGIQLQNIPTQIIINTLAIQNFQNLKQLMLIKIDIDSTKLKQLFTTNKNLKRIRKIHLQNLKLFSGIHFIHQLNLYLKVIIFINELIAQNIQQLSKINFQFLQTLWLYSIGMQNQHFVNLLNKIQSLGSSFPKLKNVKFTSNAIQTTGTYKFFQTHLPMLQSMQFAFNKDPNIFNAIFNSSHSTRLKQFILYKNAQDSIDPSLPQSSTRSLKKIVIQSGSLHSTDYQTLSKMNFQSANEFIFIFSRFFQCQSLLDIIKIIKNSKTIYLLYDKQISQLNSQCLNSSLSQYQFPFVTKIVIKVWSSHYSNLRNFFNIFLKHSNTLQQLQLQGVYPQPQTFKTIINSVNLDYITTIQLPANDLSDQMIQGIFINNLSQLTSLCLNHNPRLTSKAINLMRNKQYPKLQIIKLSQTLIDDQGLAILSSCIFPQLKQLYLANTQITVNGLRQLSKLHAPFLNKIDLSNNLFTFQQLKNINFQNFQFLEIIIIFPTMYQHHIKQIEDIYNQQRNSKRKISIVTDIIQIDQNYQEWL